MRLPAVERRPAISSPTARVERGMDVEFVGLEWASSVREIERNLDRHGSLLRLPQHDGSDREVNPVERAGNALIVRFNE